MDFMRLIFTLVLLLSLSLGQAQFIGLRDPAFVAGLNGVPPSGGAPPAGFDPSQVANLYIRLEPSVQFSGYTNGTPISNWVDAANSFVWGQETQSKCPMLTNNADINNQKAWLYFDSTDDFMTNFGTYVNQPFTVFLYGQVRRPSGSGYFFTGSGTSLGALEINRNANGGLSLLSHSTAFVCDTNLSYRTNWILFECDFATDNSVIRTNGTIAGLESGVIDTHNVTNITLGAAVNGASISRLELAAFLLYSNTVSAGDRTSLRNWFKTNYAAPLP